ncbi:hypothetical protein L798_02805 [Zootermopsis nevadensis]|uniref:Cuticle protein CPCFC domain-containing protein n=1 Tax=Zootermopsis nevadensis TaxID=136037 RepID=A0A067RPU4_ZOONE|nr:hypothetical protein L798_02805 [Zootermopsis nevadensis]
MFYKLVLFAAVAMVQAERYPAGLNPGLCPNYPYCNSAASFHYAPHAASAAHNYAPHAAAAAHNYAPHAAAAAHNYPAGERRQRTRLLLAWDVITTAVRVTTSFYNSSRLRISLNVIYQIHIYVQTMSCHANT